MNLSTIFKTLFVSLGILAAAGPLQAQQLPVTQMQLNLGRLLPTDSVQIYLEYPELTPLDRVRQKQLQAQGWTIQREPQNQFWGHRNFKVLDPSGLELTIYSDIPGKETEKNHAD